MKVALVGPELEENLALRYLHSAVEKDGHQARIFDFHASIQIPMLCEKILSYSPDVVGLSMVFTARAAEFIQLSEFLRAREYKGHITAGGHFASFHAENILKEHPSINSIVHGEGEFTLVDLINNSEVLDKVDGITFRTPKGTIKRNSPRLNPPDLDILPFPSRTPPFPRCLNKPIANMLGGRGCFGKCDFCSISAWHKQNKGKRFRFRAPASVAAEMSVLYHTHGVRIFNFHDDNFFMPSHEQSVERFDELRYYLKQHKIGPRAIQVKARPDSISPDVVSSLKELGLFRVFLGVESNAVAGLKAYGRGITKKQNHTALNILEKAGIHTTFNLLMFEPGMTPKDFSDNIGMLRSHGGFPLNFGRVEVYSGTPLQKSLEREGRLLGDYFGYTYKIKDDKMQEAYNMFMKVLGGRCYHDTGTNLTAMKVDYHYHLLKRFYPAYATEALGQETKNLISALNTNSALLLSDINTFLQESYPDREKIESHARELLKWRESFDNNIRSQFSLLSRKIEKAIPLNNHIKIPAKKRFAKVASLALFAFALQNCDVALFSDSKSDAPDPPSLNTADKLYQYDANRVAGAIGWKHEKEILAIAKAWNINSARFSLELLIDENGNITTYRLQIPDSNASLDFEAKMRQTIESWEFPQLDSKGACTVNITIEEMLYPPNSISLENPEWMICEMIALPLDSSAAKPVGVSINDTLWNDSLWNNFDSFPQAIERLIDSTIETLFQQKALEIISPIRGDGIQIYLDAIIDAYGFITMFRIRVENDPRTMLNNDIRTDLKNEIGSWSFDFGTIWRKAGKYTFHLADN